MGSKWGIVRNTGNLFFFFTRPADGQRNKSLATKKSCRNVRFKVVLCVKFMKKLSAFYNKAEKISVWEMKRGYVCRLKIGHGVKEVQSFSWPSCCFAKTASVLWNHFSSALDFQVQWLCTSVKGVKHLPSDWSETASWFPRCPEQKQREAPLDILRIL